jgi:hypothetical protein
LNLLYDDVAVLSTSFPYYVHLQYLLRIMQQAEIGR